MEITKWEYKRLTCSDEELNNLGKQGWEAVGIADSRVLIKRPSGSIQVREKPMAPEQKDYSYSE